jgi:hypothetical protein
MEGGLGRFACLTYQAVIKSLVILLPQFFVKKLRKTSNLKNPFPSGKNIAVKYCGIPQFSYNIAVYPGKKEIHRITITNYLVIVIAESGAYKAPCI